MKKQIPVTVLVCMLLAALAAPWAAVTFLPADAGMAAVLLLFFGADPVVSILTGAAAGRQSDRLWPLPLLFPLLCLLGAWIFFGGGRLRPRLPALCRRLSHPGTCRYAPLLHYPPQSRPLNPEKRAKGPYRTKFCTALFI